MALAALLLAMGFALRKGGTPGAASRSAPAVDVPPASKEPDQPDAAAPVWSTLGLVAAVLALMLVAGYALHRARKH
jgi:hypothetical protein